MQIQQQPAKSTTTDKTSNEESNLFNTNPMSIMDYFNKKMNRTKPVEAESNGSNHKGSEEEQEKEALAEKEKLVSRSKAKKSKKRKSEDQVDESNNNKNDAKEDEEVVQSDSELG